MKPHRLLAMASAACLLASFPAAGSKVYRWVDADGRAQYGDRVPSGIMAERMSNVPDGDPEAIAELQIIREGEQATTRISNRLDGPIQVALALVDDRNVSTEPAMPLTQVIGARQTLDVARVYTRDNRISSHFGVRMNVLPGEPKTQADDVVYSLPIDESVWQLGQGFHGSYSHDDEQNRYAIDLIVAEGTPVLSARDGKVMQVESGFTVAGTRRHYFAGRANLIRILHADGSMALYAHLREDGVLVKPGQHVTVGQHIGYAGNTGFSSGPHLHFAVQINAGMRLVSLPFRMVGPHGFLPLHSDKASPSP